MVSIEEFVRDRSSLSDEQVHRLRELIADWQLLSDLSFADLILWVPLRKDFKSWPTGYVAVAHIRPTTAATLFPHDVIGDEISKENITKEIVQTVQRNVSHLEIVMSIEHVTGSEEDLSDLTAAIEDGNTFVALHNSLLGE